MATGRTGATADQQRGDTAGSRPVNLEGDSPEIVAFALLRYLAQLEQGRAHQTGVVFDREWLLEAYADCLATVKGERISHGGTEHPTSSGKSRGYRR